MKLGIFTDSHYCHKEPNCHSLEKIENALEYFSGQGCDYVIFLGDLTDSESNHDEEIRTLKQVSDTLGKYDMKIFVLIGNHDTYNFTGDEFYGILGDKYRPQNICVDGKKFIFIDSCHSNNGMPYVPGFCDWADIYFPHTDMLRCELDAPDCDEVYVFSHHNLDPAVPCNHRMSNSEEIREILEKSNKVHTVFQGHHHMYIDSCVNNIRYITYPDLLRNADAFYTEEL